MYLAEIEQWFAKFAVLTFLVDWLVFEKRRSTFQRVKQFLEN